MQLLQTPKVFIMYGAALLCQLLQSSGRTVITHTFKGVLTIESVTGKKYWIVRASVLWPAEIYIITFPPCERPGTLACHFSADEPCRKVRSCFWSVCPFASPTHRSVTMKSTNFTNGAVLPSVNPVKKKWSCGAEKKETFIIITRLSLMFVQQFSHFNEDRSR